MFRSWIKLLPFFLVQIIARKYCERETTGIKDLDGNAIYCVQPFKDTLFLEIKKDK